ncbi:aldo/keto reductase [Chenggangzhangella methanolivorans]|uniref:Aldo/keto reductase n=1 Tax=Chenggangzhangella methanolivorans TaxID=1437009 RepID=A0A9E6R6L7_9HYPH|nr:aldo/keto reductase [Chenggangzhangella methanolivorans]QZN98259.1 aldo/keto reductase [Chenggangzhangella methanolivorans]
MDKKRLGRTGLEISPIVFGGNVFGWTIDEATSVDVLDAFVDHGFDAIDTADVYSAWAPGNSGGESEAIIGRWLKSRPGMREKVKIFTKVGSEMGSPERKGLSERWILSAVEESLRRLGVERIDLYFSHWPDDGTAFDETLGAYDKLLKAGKIGAIGASNLDADRLSKSLSVASVTGLPRYDVLQPEYNLYDRGAFVGPLRDLCVAEEIGVVTYYSLASGFLTGKYRSKADLSQSKRGGGVGKYLDDRGLAILTALDDVAEKTGAKPAEVALAWLITSRGVTAPIASATSRAPVESFARAATLTLSPSDVARLDAAGSAKAAA